MNYSLFVANMTPHIPLPLCRSYHFGLSRRYSRLFMGICRPQASKNSHFARREGRWSCCLQAAIQMTKFTFTRVAYLLQRNGNKNVVCIYSILIAKKVCVTSQNLNFFCSLGTYAEFLLYPFEIRAMAVWSLPALVAFKMVLSSIRSWSSSPVVIP